MQIGTFFRRWKAAINREKLEANSGPEPLTEGTSRKGGVNEPPTSPPPPLPVGQNRPVMPPNQMIKEGQVNKPEEKPKGDQNVTEFVTMFNIDLGEGKASKSTLRLGVDLDGLLHINYRGTYETFGGNMGSNVSYTIAGKIMEILTARKKKNARKKKA